MLFLDENYDQITSLKDHPSRLMWVFDVDKSDFFIRQYQVWYSLSTPTYHMRIAGVEIHIPANYNILIGDYDAGLDIITPNEIIGRNFDALSFHPKLISQSGSLTPIEVVGYTEEEHFLIPFTKNPTPIFISDKIAILVGNTDFYNKIKNLTFDEII